MDLLYSRAQGGQRVKASKPYRRGQTLSIIGAVSLVGVVAAMYGEWATDGVAFLTFIQTMLVPHGHVVIMDNVSFHKLQEVKEAIESTGARLLFLPPYSADLSPIELMWSKLKQYLRKKAARTLGSFHQALLEALKH